LFERLVGELLHRIDVLDSLLPGHEQRQYLQVDPRLRPADLRDGLLPVQAEVSQQRTNHRLA
jgi:hypothetical protein